MSDLYTWKQVLVPLTDADIDLLVFLAERAASDARWFYPEGAADDFDDLACRLRAVDPNSRSAICPTCRRRITVVDNLVADHEIPDGGSSCLMSGRPFRGSTTRA